jgi:hypothetical protein
MSDKPDYRKMDAVACEKRATEVQKDTLVRLEATRSTKLAELAKIDRDHQSKRRPVQAAIAPDERRVSRPLDPIVGHLDRRRNE